MESIWSLLILVTPINIQCPTDSLHNLPSGSSAGRIATAYFLLKIRTNFVRISLFPNADTGSDIYGLYVLDTERGNPTNKLRLPEVHRTPQDTTGLPRDYRRTLQDYRKTPQDTTELPQDTTGLTLTLTLTCSVLRCPAVCHVCMR